MCMKSYTFSKSLTYSKQCVQGKKAFTWRKKATSRSRWQQLTLKQEALYRSCTTWPMAVLEACGYCFSSLCTTNSTNTFLDNADPSSSASRISLNTSSCIPAKPGKKWANYFLKHARVTQKTHSGHDLFNSTSHTAPLPFHSCLHQPQSTPNRTTSVLNLDTRSQEMRALWPWR